MSSRRKTIREDVVTRLKAAVADVEDRVFPSRPEALGDRVDLPCICIYTRDEKVETLSSRPTVQDRKLSLAVEILAQGNEDLDAAIDELAVLVEEELLAHGKQAPASGLYSSVTLESTEVGFNDSGRIPLGAARLTFEIGYQITF